MASELEAPAGWKWIPLADLSLGNTITYGVVQPGADDPHGVPMIRVNNFTANGLDLSNLAHIAPSIEAKYKRTRLRPHDVLITVVGSVGQVAIVPAKAINWNIARAVALIRPEDLKLSRWIALCLRSPFSQHSLNVTANTTVQTTVNLKELKQLAIPMPPAREREEIAATLSALDDRIELLRQTSTTFEAIAQALFKSWFIDFDPIRAKAEGREPDGMDAATAALFPDSFEDSPLGLIPWGWHASSLSDCMELNPQRVLRKGSLASYLDMANAPTQGHRPAEVTQRELGSGSKFSNGDTLLAKITPCLENGKTAFVDFLADNEVGWGSTEFIVMRPKAPLPPFWGYLLARMPNFRAFAIQAMTGTSGRQRVDLGSLKQFSVVVPDDSVAQAFGKIIEPLRARIAAASSHADNLTQLRDTLLPRLISGKLRLPEVSGLIEEAIA